jgi:hypothetical protein
MSVLSTPTHKLLEQKKKKKKKKKRKQRAHPNEQKPKKRQNRVIRNEQNLVPKDMGNGLTQPSKTQLSLKKRQRAQHH